jgi:replicative DNA helicase
LDELSKQESGLRGISTGFDGLDNILAGLQKSDLIILAARPSMGKSALGLNFALNTAIKNKTPVGIFSLEMSKDQIIDRLISGISGVDLWKLRTGKLSNQGMDNDFTKIQRAFSVLSDVSIYIDDTFSTTVLQMKSMARRMQTEQGLGLIVVDYLQLMEPLNLKASPVQQVSENSRALKGLARELNVPVLVLSQLSRAVEQRSPQIPRLSDLRQSGSIEQDADVVMFIYREDVYRKNSIRKNIADILISKHRNGPIGKVELFFDEQRVSFRNIKQDVEEV